MANLNSLVNKHKIHFIGIGGISMSGLAEIVHTKGYTVTGSDMKSSLTTKHLEELGITVHYGHNATNIADDVDLIVYTAAVKNDNPEIIMANQKNIDSLTRSKFLGILMKQFNIPICVSGTHGKTTTTSMLSHGLLSANLDPTISVGGILKAIHGNIRIGDSPYFLTEACEYCDSFLDFFPNIGIILNIEEDHMDYFKDLAQINESFRKFASKIPSDGFLSVNGSVAALDEIINSTACKVETFGIDGNYNWTAKDISFNDKACATFKVYYDNEFISTLTLNVPGTHNILNCLSVCSVFNFLGLPLDLLNKGLENFTGADQRFEIKGSYDGITVVDDYAHHPTEIAATLDVAKAYPHNKLYLVFQPHTYTRTRAFLKEFASVLSTADEVILTDIYAAREKNPGDISSTNILELINKSGTPPMYMKDFNEIANFIKQNAVSGDLVITMGAGNVNEIASILLNN